MKFRVQPNPDPQHCQKPSGSILPPTLPNTCTRQLLTWDLFPLLEPLDLVPEVVGNLLGGEDGLPEHGWRGGGVEGGGAAPPPFRRAARRVQRIKVQAPLQCDTRHDDLI